MSFTATLTKLERNRDEWRISILYTDTVSDFEFEKHYRRKSITKRALRKLARSDALELLNNASSDVDIPIGATIDVTPDVVPTPTPPTQAEIDRNAWFDDYNKLNALLQVTSSIPSLATAQASTLIDNLRTSLAASWDNSYLGDLQ